MTTNGPVSPVALAALLLAAGILGCAAQPTTAADAADAVTKQPPLAPTDGSATKQPAPPAADGARKPLAVGDVIRLPGGEATVREWDVTPVVRNKYSERFKFDKSGNPKLAQLREQEKLDEVIRPGKDEFEKQVLLLDWTYRRFKKFGTPSSNPQGALEILKAVDEGGTFYCAYYARVLVSAAASLGWIDRPLAIRLGNRVKTPGSTEHAITEIWSNQYRKWVMFDPTYALYVEKDGVPLNAWEIRQEWFYRGGERLDFVIGAERKKYKRKDMPIFRARHEGFGDLALGPRTIEKYAFIGYVPNTDLMDSPLDYAGMFISKDEKYCDGVEWHTRDNPADPAAEPYFPLSQAAVTLSPADGTVLAVAVETMTPNFAHYVHAIDGRNVCDGAPARWKLHPGRNTLDIFSVSKFGVTGPPSRIVLELKK